MGAIFQLLFCLAFAYFLCTMYQRPKSILLSLIFTWAFLSGFAQTQSEKSSTLELTFEWDQKQDWPKNTSWQLWEDQWIPFTCFDLPQSNDGLQIQNIAFIGWSPIKKQKRSPFPFQPPMNGSIPFNISKTPMEKFRPNYFFILEKKKMVSG